MFSALLISAAPVRCQALTAVAVETGQLLLARSLEEYPHGIGLAKLMQVAPEVVLLDLQGKESALKCADQIRQHNPRTPILGFTDLPPAMGAADLAAFEAVLPFPPAPEELAKQVNEAVRRSLSDAKKNLLVFLPAKAGSGATTVAWNTAVALAELSGKRVLVMEADFRSGVLSFMLDQVVEGSIQVVLKPGGEVDAFRLEGSLTEREGVSVLLSDRTVPEPAPGWEVYARLVDAATSRYDAVLVDLPEAIPPAMHEFVRRAWKIILVSTPDVVALKLAARARNELILSGIPKSRVQVVLNRWEAGDLNPHDVEECLQQPVAHLFPNDSRTVRTSILCGERIRPESELWKSYRSWATKLTAAPPPSPETLGDRLRGVLHREAWR